MDFGFSKTAQEEFMSTTIELLKNGPLQVSGDFRILDNEGQEIAHKGEHVHLCRCGESSVKPFCDGSHQKEEFVAD